MKKIILIFTCFVLSFHVFFAQTQKNELQVIYISNEGFLIKSTHHKVLIDALFTDGYGIFSCPSKEVINQIMEAKSPFDSVNLCFLTHYHKDHSDSKLTKDYLTKYPQIKLVTTRPSLVFIDGEQFGFVKLKKQFYEITPEINQSISQTINNIPIRVLGLKHLSYYQNDIDLEEYMYNVGYYFDLDGIKIFHSGDIKINNLKDYIAKNGKWTDPIDVAFLYYGMFDDGKSDLEYVIKALHPKNIVLMHLPPSLYKEWSVKIDQLKLTFPNIILFYNTLDTQTFKL